MILHESRPARHLLGYAGGIAVGIAIGGGMGAAASNVGLPRQAPCHQAAQQDDSGVQLP